MLTKENISKVAKEKITDIGGFLVDVKMNTNNNIESNKESMNEKINNYSFIQTKKYNEDLTITFKK